MQRQDQAQAFVFVEMQPPSDAIRIARDALPCEQDALGLAGCSGCVEDDPRGLFPDGVAAPFRFEVGGPISVARQQAVRGRNRDLRRDLLF